MFLYIYINYIFGKYEQTIYTMKNKYIDYDFADEISEKNIKKEEYKYKGFIKRTTTINDKGVLKNRKGTYISFEYNDEEVDYYSLIKELSKSIKLLIKSKKINKNSLVLIYGIGNEFYSSDSLGPKTVKKIAPTSHLSNNKKINGICTLIPGVKGITGLESARIAKGLVKEYPIECIIAIDSLITHSVNRLFKVIQITDAGITPGSGLNRSLKSLNEKYLKIPVIAICVATCLPSSSLIEDYLEKVEDKLNKPLTSIFDEVLSQIEKNYYTPKDTEEEIENLSLILSKSIEDAFKN